MESGKTVSGLGAVLVGVCMLMAQCGSSVAVETALPFLKFPVGAPAHALAGAYTAKSTDASAVYWNPSNLSAIYAPELFLYHSQFVLGSMFSFASIALPARSGSNKHNSSYGISLSNFTQGGFVGRDQKGDLTEEFSLNDYAVVLSYALSLNQHLRAGGSVKGIVSQIYRHSAQTVAADLAVTYQISSTLRMAVSAMNMGPGITYYRESAKLPTQLSVGLDRKFPGNFEASADARYEINNMLFSSALGLEVTILNLSFLRIGYSTYSNSSLNNTNSLDYWRGLSMGTGLKVMRDYKFDYAFVPLGDLGQTHHLSMSRKF